VLAAHLEMNQRMKQQIFYFNNEPSKPIGSVSNPERPN
jgi:hypothetical protein